MTIGEMHYDFKKKLNKIDSQKYKNLLIPEIDWTLNEAQELFVNSVLKPRMKSYFGFKMDQELVHNIKPLIVNGQGLDITDNMVTLPLDYWYAVSAQVGMEKGDCVNIKGDFYIKPYDDNLCKSSFEWRTVFGEFYNNGIAVYDDGTFKNKTFYLDYIKKLDYIHNAEFFRNGSYTLPSGKVLTGHQDCILPEHTHREIVDLAVLLATGEIEAPDYQVKLNKIRLDNV